MINDHQSVSEFFLTSNMSSIIEQMREEESDMS